MRSCTSSSFLPRSPRERTSVSRWAIRSAANMSFGFPSSAFFRSLWSCPIPTFSGQALSAWRSDSSWPPPSPLFSSMPWNSCREELGWSRDYSSAWPLDWAESALRSLASSRTSPTSISSTASVRFSPPLASSRRSCRTSNPPKSKCLLRESESSGNLHLEPEALSVPRPGTLRSYPYSLTRLLPVACYNSTPSWPMPDTVPLAGEAVLEVLSPDGARRYARVTQTPFMIGRGAETGNHLQLSDRRISRNCAAVVIEANRFYVEDRGQRRGLFVNG